MKFCVSYLHIKQGNSSELLREGWTFLWGVNDVTFSRIPKVPHFKTKEELGNVYVLRHRVHNLHS